MREESERRRQALADHEQRLRASPREEATLRRGIEEQIEHLGRTYAEIERLNASIAEISADRDRTLAQIAQMKTTRAWRLHEWWYRIRS